MKYIAETNPGEAPVSVRQQDEDSCPPIDLAEAEALKLNPERLAIIVIATRRCADAARACAEFFRGMDNDQASLGAETVAAQLDLRARAIARLGA